MTLLSATLLCCRGRPLKRVIAPPYRCLNPDFFPNFSRIFRRFFAVFASFSKFSDVFGPVRTFLDAFVYVRMHTDAFGCVWPNLENLDFCQIFESILAVLARLLANLEKYFLLMIIYSVARLRTGPIKMCNEKFAGRRPRRARRPTPPQRRRRASSARRRAARRSQTSTRATECTCRHIARIYGLSTSRPRRRRGATSIARPIESRCVRGRA